MSKQEMRAVMRARRKALPAAEKKKLDLELEERLFSSPLFREAEKIFLFLSLPEEPDTTPILHYALELKKKCALPRIKNNRAGVMEFYYCEKLADLRPGPFGLQEPDTACELAMEAPDIILLPGLAFDRQGGRLGYGKGFYDRYLGRMDLKKSILTGYAYSFQIVEKVPVEKTDFPVNCIVTDREMIWA